MTESIIIRNEAAEDYRKVEELIRKSFYNLYVPGCAEHYLAHEIRNHDDFIHELDLVMEKDGEIIGNIMYTKAKLVDEQGNEKSILTFGPVCISPEHQRKGYGKALIEASFAKARDMGYDTVVIVGSPANYVSVGFKSCKQYNICLEDGGFPAAMLAKELIPNVLDGRRWTYFQSPAFDIDEKEVDRFDEEFPPMEKKWQPSQEEFYIMSRSMIL